MRRDEQRSSVPCTTLVALVRKTDIGKSVRKTWKLLNTAIVQERLWYSIASVLEIHHSSRG